MLINNNCDYLHFLSFYFYEAKIDQIMDAIQSYPVLYDKSLKQFRDINVKDNAWKAIAEMVELSVEECQRVYKYKRTQLSKYLLSRKGASGAGAKDVSQVNLSFEGKPKFMCLINKMPPDRQ